MARKSLVSASLNRICVVAPIDRIAAGFIGSRNRTHQALSSGEFPLLCEEEILVAKKFALTYHRASLFPVCNKCPTTGP
jgi:hypothetical protein